MQYILTEQEYKALTPINKVNELEENVRLLRIKRKFSRLKTGDESVFTHTFFWLSMYFLTISSDICPTDSTK